MKELEQLIEQVTRQVLAALAAEHTSVCDGRRSMLVLGETAALPASYACNAVVFTLEDYLQTHEISHYDTVAITSLSFAQMADVALGRGGDPTSDAILQALLSGVETVMTKDALPHRRFSAKGNPVLYQLLEDYGKRLERYGIQILTEQDNHDGEGQNCALHDTGRLITEAVALQMTAQGSPVRLPPRAILTPSARDVFLRAGVSVMSDFEGGGGNDHL